MEPRQMRNPVLRTVIMPTVISGSRPIPLSFVKKDTVLNSENVLQFTECTTDHKCYNVTNK